MKNKKAITGLQMIAGLIIAIALLAIVYSFFPQIQALAKSVLGVGGTLTSKSLEAGG